MASTTMLLIFEKCAAYEIFLTLMSEIAYNHINEETLYFSGKIKLKYM